MKINILGDLIETKYIYRISNIKYIGKGYGFDIYFINKKFLCIELKYDTVYPNIIIGDITNRWKFENSIEFAPIIESVRIIVENLRTEIIDLWNQDKSKIKQLEFNLDLKIEPKLESAKNINEMTSPIIKNVLKNDAA